MSPLVSAFSSETRGLALRDLVKGFSGPAGVVQVLDGLTLQVREGEVVTIYGPNGSGKTTLFNALAGFDPCDAGQVLLGGAALPSNEVAYLFQDYQGSLFPWLDLIDNVTFPMKVAGGARSRREAIGIMSLRKFGLDRFAKSYPYQLSGGMQQRLGLARTLLSQRRVVLLDEPFTALDQVAFDEVLATMSEPGQMSSQFVLCITHDLDAGILFSDRIVVLGPRPGRVIDDVAVPLLRPRRRAMLLEPAFAEVRARVLKSSVTWNSRT